MKKEEVGSKKREKETEESGIRTHAPEGTGALNQRLGPLGHLSVIYNRSVRHLTQCTLSLAVSVR